MPVGDDPHRVSAGAAIVNRVSSAGDPYADLVWDPDELAPPDDLDAPPPPEFDHYGASVARAASVNRSLDVQAISTPTSFAMPPWMSASCTLLYESA